MTPQQIELADRCQHQAKQMQAEQAELERLQAEYKNPNSKLKGQKTNVQ